MNQNEGIGRMVKRESVGLLFAVAGAYLTYMIARGDTEQEWRQLKRRTCLAVISVCNKQIVWASAMANKAYRVYSKECL